MEAKRKSASRLASSLLLIMMALAIVVAGCSSGSGKSEPGGSEQAAAPPDSAKNDGTSTGEKVTIRFGIAMDPARYEPYKKVVDKWNAEHPNIEVKLENTPWSDYWQKLQVLTASNSMPDVWNYVPGFGAQWLLNDQLLPLDEFIAQDPDANLDDLQPAMREYMTYKGKFYGFPYDFAALVLIYNKDLFDQAGLDYPTDDWTFDDVRNAAIAITERVKSDKGKVYGLLSTMGNLDWISDSYYHAFGASLITEDGKFGANNEGGVQTLQYFKDNIDMGITPKPEPGGGMNQSLWISGLVGMVIDGAWAIPTYEEVDFDWDMAQFPLGPAGRHNVSIGGTFVISNQTKHPKEAYEFLKYVTNTENLSEIVAKTGAGVPGRRSSEAALSPKMKKYAELIADTKPYNAIIGSLELFTIQQKEVEAVWFGVKTPEEALASIEAQANEVLKAH